MKKTATEGYPYSHGAAPREEEVKGVNPIICTSKCTMAV